MQSVKKDCIRHLKDNYMVEKDFWTDNKYTINVKAYTHQGRTIIPLHKVDGELVYEYKHTDGFGNQKIVSAVIHPSLVTFVPDGFMEKSIEVIKAYIDWTHGMDFPSVTFIPGNKYRINLWT